MTASTHSTRITITVECWTKSQPMDNLQYSHQHGDYSQTETDDDKNVGCSVAGVFSGVFFVDQCCDGVKTDSTYGCFRNGNETYVRLSFGPKIRQASKNVKILCFIQFAM